MSVLCEAVDQEVRERVRDYHWNYSSNAYHFCVDVAAIQFHQRDQIPDADKKPGDGHGPVRQGLTGRIR